MSESQQTAVFQKPEMKTDNPWRDYALALQAILDYHARVRCMDCADDEYGRLKATMVAARNAVGLVDLIGIVPEANVR